MTSSNSKIMKTTEIMQSSEIMKTSEFVSNNSIPTLLSNYFPGHKVFHSFNNEYTHFLIKVTINDLLNAPVVNWEMNRPPDMIRCNDIAKFIYKSKYPIDSMIYLSYNNLKRTFEVLDGIHRITALRIIKKENSNPINLMTPNDFGYEKDAEPWLFESYIMVNIRFNSTIGDLIETFQTLNKSNPVPELYMKDNSKEKKIIIEDIVKQYQKLFKSHFTSSQNPVVPNINREKFIDLLDRIYDKYNISTDSKDKIDELLTKTNTFIQNNIPSKISKKAIDKCNETQCYLFLYKPDQLYDMI